MINYLNFHVFFHFPFFHPHPKNLHEKKMSNQEWTVNEFFTKINNAKSEGKESIIAPFQFPTHTIIFFKEAERYGVGSFNIKEFEEFEAEDGTIHTRITFPKKEINRIPK